MYFRYAIFAVAVALLANLAKADDWANWRGPAGNGTAPGSGYATTWSDSTNVAWKVDLPGKAGSTPIVVRDAVFMTSAIDGKDGLIKFDRSGTKLWEVTLGAEKEGKHRKGSGSNPSPISDGDLVFVYYKSGDFAAVDFSGKIVWQKNLQQEYGEDTLWWDLGTSPVLTEKHVVVACVQSGPSYLAAFDKQTGELAWKFERNTGAPEEAAQTYATPIVTHYKGQEQIIVLGADQVTCHDAKDGKQLWYLSGMNPGQERFFRSISSPVLSGDIVIAPYARGNSLTAIRMGGSGDISKSHKLWSIESPSADVPTPAATAEHVFVCTDKGVVACLESATAKEVWRTELQKNRNAYSASPILVDGKLYLVREDAAAFVLDAKTGEQIGEANTLSDQYVVATPVFVDGDILLRTFSQLYCFRSKESASRD
ncbi:MAG: PQQ-binding-like beta-propeller repeat protein [Planctomycetaceae bacterium]|nr:PQQ-binding-like beta-propeller repeat protein [Planctomycetaceae bacterium]MCB9951211.1 PQQ-binding-like beta-propeller repeat protein [Planctomycetaceae bacterium]